MTGPAMCDVEAYERAVEIYRALLGELNACIDQETNQVRARHLRDEAVRYAREKRQLRSSDRDAVDRVIAEYPAIVRGLREAWPMAEQGDMT